MKLCEIVKCVSGDIYLSGQGGKKYMNEDMFDKHNII